MLVAEPVRLQLSARQRRTVRFALIEHGDAAHFKSMNKLMSAPRSDTPQRTIALQTAHVSE